MSESTHTRSLTGDSAILARRYAGALYELAKADGQIDATVAELQGLKSVCRDSDELRHIISNPTLSRGKLMDTVKLISKSAELSVLTGNFLLLLAKNRRLNLLSGTIDAFMAKLAVARGEFTAEIGTANPLNKNQESALIAQLQKLTGGKVQLEIKQIPALLGGLTIKMGSRLIDASLRGKLARLERQLKAQREAV
ncbi:MAG: ATP synthase F1 subunit delta [Alphaproteobacteria bacterium]|nr:ATP synthase F1 subunit delta [Alphaproteobacteria bacterium]